VDSHSPYSLILQYFEPMVLTDKARLLQNLLDKTDSFGWGLNKEESENDKATIPELCAAMLKHYTANYLKAAIKKNDGMGYYYSRGKLNELLKKELGMMRLI
jgi:hypothetical protein